MVPYIIPTTHHSCSNLTCTQQTMNVTNCVCNISNSTKVMLDIFLVIMIVFSVAAIVWAVYELTRRD